MAAFHFGDPLAPTRAWVAEWEAQFPENFTGYLAAYRARVSAYWSSLARDNPRAFGLLGPVEVVAVGALAAIWIFVKPAETDVIRTVGCWEHPEIDTYEFQHAPVNHVVDRLTQVALDGDEGFHLLDTQLLTGYTANPDHPFWLPPQLWLESLNLADRDAHAAELGEALVLASTMPPAAATDASSSDKRTRRFAWTMPKSGQQVGSWQLVRVLGEGGNAIVWLGRPRDGPDVALKVLKVPEGPERYDRFAEEVRIHLDVLRDVPGVLPVLAADVRSGEPIVTAPWLAMPVARPLAEHLGEDPDIVDTVAAAIKIAQTLAALLEQFGLSHRDVKPANLYWWNGAPAVGDFGLVAVPDRARMTRSDRDLGPRDFLPPEMRADRPNREGPPADVFELGLTVFALLGGDPPRDGLRSDEPLHHLAALRGDPQLRSLDRILQRATSYSARDRLTMGEFAAEMQAWVDPPLVRDVVDIEVFRRQLQAMPEPYAVTTPSVDHALIGEVGQRIMLAAHTTFQSMNSLGLASTTSNVRLFERLDPVGLDIRTGHSLSLQRAGSDGVVWIAGGAALGAVGTTLHLLTGWVVGHHDDYPETVAVHLVTIDPRSEVSLLQLDSAVAQWGDSLPRALAAFVTANEAWGRADVAPRPGPDDAPPELLDLRTHVRTIGTSGRAELVLAARLRDLVAGLAGSGYTSSPSQARAAGPGGETRVLMLSADGNRVCGTRYDAFMEGTAYLESFDPRGDWTIESILLVDQAGHSTRLSTEDLEARGFPTAFRVPDA